MTVFFLIYKRHQHFQVHKGLLNLRCFDYNILLRQVTGAMPEFYLRILTGISPFGVAFLFILLISLFKPLTIKYLNENTFGSLKEFYLHNTWMIFVFLNCL